MFIKTNWPTSLLVNNLKVYEFKILHVSESSKHI